jgi:ATP/maltotriose-dependent transcriptional regulator MalT
VSRRDLEVLYHLAAGRSTAAIATAMSISTNTVRTHVHHLQNKLGVPVRDQVVPRARALGLLAPAADPADPAGSPVAIPGRTGLP